MNRLRRIRLIQGKTIEEVANKLGITKQRYYQIELRGLERSNPKNVKKVCDYFGVNNPFELMGIHILKRIPETQSEWDCLLKMLNEEKARMGFN